MGTRGTKRLKQFASNINNDQMLFISVESLLDTAKTKKLYQNEALDIEKLIGLIPDIRIQYVPLDSSISGSLSYSDGKWIIKVNKLHHKHRQRFTLGHELAHYVLHKNEKDNFTDTTFFRGLSCDNLERTANEFAAKLLMPEDKVRTMIRECNIRNVGELAEIFGVSAAAMLYRIKQLGYKTKE